MRFLSRLLLLPLLSASIPPVHAKEKPNILIIVTDEHNFRTLGCYREQMTQDQAEMWGPNTVVETPHIDRLAREGVICTKAYATAPVCSPCRAAMITGLYPQNTGVPTNNLKLRDDVPTLAKFMRPQGYRTAFVGKWHLGGVGKPEWSPVVDGGFEHKAFMFNRGHWKKFRLRQGIPEVAAKNRKGKPSYDVDGADERSFSTDFLTDRTIEFIQESDDRPFLAVVSYPDPHGPNSVRPPYDHMFDHLRFLAPRTYGRDDMSVPGWVGTKNHAKFRGDQMSRYFGMVKCIDDNIGRLLKVLDDNKRIDSTIILFVSDHGDLCYEHDRLNKGNPYEGSARVPMLIRYPAALRAGTVFRGPVGTVDVTPTLLGLAGLETNAEFEGRDLTDLLSGAAPAVDGAPIFLRNAGTSPKWIAAIDERFKLVLSVNDRPWLLDLEQDPDELLNFFQRPGTQAVTARLATALRKYASDSRDQYVDHPRISDALNVCLAGDN